jgi:hypothetical protein
MTSIIKVDTLQTAAGGVPTASDLGINVTGTLVQVVVKTSSTVVTQTSSALAGFGLSQSFTPKFASSKILIIAAIAGQHHSYSDLGIRFDLTKDGTQIKYWPYVDYHSVDNSQNISVQNLQWYGDATNTNARTYEFRFQPSNGSGTANVNTYNAPSQMTIMEIAG